MSWMTTISIGGHFQFEWINRMCAICRKWAVRAPDQRSSGPRTGGAIDPRRLVGVPLPFDGRQNSPHTHILPAFQTNNNKMCRCEPHMCVPDDWHIMMTMIRAERYRAWIPHQPHSHGRIVGSAAHCGTSSRHRRTGAFGSLVRHTRTRNVSNVNHIDAIDATHVHV